MQPTDNPIRHETPDEEPSTPRDSRLSRLSLPARNGRDRHYSHHNSALLIFFSSPSPMNHEAFPFQCPQKSRTSSSHPRYSRSIRIPSAGASGQSTTTLPLLLHPVLRLMLLLLMITLSLPLARPVAARGSVTALPKAVYHYNRRYKMVDLLCYVVTSLSIAVHRQGGRLALLVAPSQASPAHPFRGPKERSRKPLLRPDS